MAKRYFKKKKNFFKKKQKTYRVAKRKTGRRRKTKSVKVLSRRAPAPEIKYTEDE